MSVVEERSVLGRVVTMAVAIVGVLSVVVFGSGGAARATAAGVVHGRLTAVSCPDASFCMAVGLRYAGTDYESNSVLAGLAYRSNGPGWTAMATVAAQSGYRSIELDDVSCTSASFCTALGFMRTGAGDHGRQVLIAERWNGSSWRFMRIQRPGGVYTVGLS